MAPTPQERLRAFEDEKFGKDAPRHDNKIEMGHGSPFKKMSDEDKARYDALVALVDANAVVESAQADLSGAQARLAEAEKVAAAAEARLDPPQRAAEEPAPVDPAPVFMPPREPVHAPG